MVSKSIRVCYHTQEYRPDDNFLDSPIKCNSKNAWLGVGYYFWVDLDYAHYWGEDFKKNYNKYPGYYSIYKAEVDTSTFIDTVFSEDGYNFFKNSIEDSFDKIKLQNGKVSLETVNRFLAEKVWPQLNINGIIYDDRPTNRINKERIYSNIPDLYYKKRIQLVSFKLENIYNFAIYLDEQS